MKYALLLSTVFILIFLNTYAQQNNFSRSKETLVYSFRRAEIAGYNEEGKELIKKDIAIDIDTIIDLQGKDRKLIVFSKCLNDIVLNMTFPIIKGDYNIQTEEGGKILGVPLTSSVKNDGPSEISAIYQIEHVMYLLTLPKNYFYTDIRNKEKLAEIDKKLLEAADTIYGFGYYQMLQSSIRVENDNFPLHAFLITKGGNEDTTYIPGKNDYLFSDYLRYKNTVKFKNKYFDQADKYTSLPYKGVVYNTVYLSYKYGIVKAISNAESKYDGSFVNTLELKE